MATSPEPVASGIPVQCPACGHAETVANSWAGKTVTCPKCDKAVPVVTPDAASSPAPLFSIETRDEGAKPRRARRVVWPWYYHVLTHFAVTLSAAGFGGAYWVVKQPPETFGAILQHVDAPYREAARYAIAAVPVVVGLTLSAAVLLAIDIAGSLRVLAHQRK